MKNKVSIVVAALAILLAGCHTTYRMKELSTDKTAPRAFLEHQDKSVMSKFFITKIDNTPRGLGFVDYFELVPGKRSVTAVVNGGMYNGEPITRYFNAEAGKHYLFVVTDDLKKQRWT